MAFLATGLGAIAERATILGWPALFLGAALLLLVARPADSPQERIVLDDRGVTDMLGKSGPVPWTDITGAEVHYLGRFKVIAVKVRNAEYWKEFMPVSQRRLQGFAQELQLPPVLLVAQGIDLPAEELARMINDRVKG